MKPETLIYDLAKQIIPARSQKTVFFAGLTPTSQEVYFYALIDGRYRQCYALAEAGMLDAGRLTAVFAEIAAVLKDSKAYKADKYNTAAVVIDKTGVKLIMEYHDLEAGRYQIHKAWKHTYIG